MCGFGWDLFDYFDIIYLSATDEKRTAFAPLNQGKSHVSEQLQKDDQVGGPTAGLLNK